MSGGKKKNDIDTENPLRAQRKRRPQ